MVSAIPKGRDKKLVYLGGAYIAALILSFVSLSVYIAYDLPQSDHWEWMHKLLIPYVDNEIDLITYLSGPFRPFLHSHILTLSFQLLNYKVFGLRYDLECYVGLISLLLTSVFLLYSYWRSASSKLPFGYVLLTLCALTAVILNPYNINTVPLVQFEYFYLLVAVIYLWVYDSALKEKRHPFWLFIFTAVQFLLGDAIGIVGIFAVTGHLILFAPLRKKTSYILGMGLSILPGYLIASNFFTYAGPKHLNKIESIPYVLSHKLDSLWLIINGYSQGIIDHHSITRRLFGEAYIEIALLVGVVSILLSLLAVYLYVTRKKEIGTSLPCLLIIFSAIFVVGVLLSRFPLEGPLYSMNDRYQRLSVPGFFGMIWIFSLTIFKPTSAGQLDRYLQSRTSQMLLVILISATLLIGALSSVVRWRSVAFEKERLDTMAGGIVAFTENTDIDIYKYLYNRHCYSDDCINAVFYLKANQLSVFRPDHPVKRPDMPIRDYINQKSFFAPYDRETHGWEKAPRNDQ